MNRDVTFGEIVKERRNILGLTQAELARRVGCAVVVIRRIGYDTLRPPTQIAERLAMALNIAKEEWFAFVRLARSERGPTEIPSPTPIEYIQQHLTQRIPSLVGIDSNRDPELLVALDPVIARATAKDPAERYPDVPTLLADFHRIVATQARDDHVPGVSTAPLLDGQLQTVSGERLPALENPYKGLRAFGEVDADHFYGRETLIQALLVQRHRRFSEIRV